MEGLLWGDPMEGLQIGRASIKGHPIRGSLIRGSPIIGSPPIRGCPIRRCLSIRAPQLEGSSVGTPSVIEVSNGGSPNQEGIN